MGILRTQLESTQTGGAEKPSPGPATSALGGDEGCSQVGGRRETGRREEERKGRGGVGQRHGGDRELLDGLNIEGLLGHTKEDGLYAAVRDRAETCIFNQQAFTELLLCSVIGSGNTVIETDKNSLLSLRIWARD